MKLIMKIAIACIPVLAVLASPTPDAFAQCYAGEECKKLLPVSEQWMNEGETLAADEEYVPGYEDPGAVECMQNGETPGEGYQSVEGCSSLASTIPQRGFILVTNVRLAKQKQRKKRKKGQCVPPATVSYGLDETKSGDYTYHFKDKKGCGQKWRAYYPWPENCGAPRANPDCQG